MSTAVIVSYARTGSGKAFRGSFTDTHGAVLAGHAIEHAEAPGLHHARERRHGRGEFVRGCLT